MAGLRRLFDIEFFFRLGGILGICIVALEMNAGQIEKAARLIKWYPHRPPITVALHRLTATAPLIKYRVYLVDVEECVRNLSNWPAANRLSGAAA